MMTYAGSEKQLSESRDSIYSLTGHDSYSDLPLPARLLFTQWARRIHQPSMSDYCESVDNIVYNVTIELRLLLM